MSKKIIGLLLAICLVVGLVIPAMPQVKAEGEALTSEYKLRVPGYSTNYTLTNYDTPIYFKTQFKEAGGQYSRKDANSKIMGPAYDVVPATENDWTGKLIWNTGEAGPTLYLDGFIYDDYWEESTGTKVRYKGDTNNYLYSPLIAAPTTAPLTIVLTGEDSFVQSYFGIHYGNNLTIRSEGDTKLTLKTQSSGIVSMESAGTSALPNVSGAKLTLDANLDMSIRSAYKQNHSAAVIHTYDADLVINGGNINVDVDAASGSILGILARGTTGNLIINGGHITANSVMTYAAANATLGSQGGRVIINGGTVNVDAVSNGIYGATGVEINNGTVKVKDCTAGIVSKGDIKIDGGELEISGVSCAFCDVEGINQVSKAPAVKSGINGLVGANAEEAAPYDGTNYVAKYAKFGANVTPSTRETTTPSETTAPAEQSSAPTETAAPAPTYGYGETLSVQPSVKVGTTILKLTNYDKPIYTKNDSTDTQDTEGNPFTKWGQTKTDAGESNYNLKFVWNAGDAAPTLILRGFKLDEWNNEVGKMAANSSGSGLQTYAITTGNNAPLNIVLTGEDSLIEAKFGITFYNDLTITSEGNTKLTMYNASSCLATNESAGDLTINANLDLSLGSFYNTQYAAAVIHTCGGDIVIDGGTIDCKIRQEEAKTPVGIAARNGGNLTINGGTITAMSIVDQGATNGCIKADGKLTITGGTVNANPVRAVGLYGKTGVEITGGTVNITSPWHGINAGTTDAPAEIVINGGVVEVTAGAAAFYKAPVLGAGIGGYAGASVEDYKNYDETKYKSKYVKLGKDLEAPSDSAPTSGTTPDGSAPTSGTTLSGTTTAPTFTPAEPGSKIPTQPSVKLGGVTLKLTNYDTPVYSRNYSQETQDTAGTKFTKWGQTVTGATEENYNAKFVWNATDPAPTLLLRGMKIDEWNNGPALMEGKYNKETGKYSALQTDALTTDKKIPLNIVLTGEDSLIEAKFGITFCNDLTITSEGAAKLTMNNVSSCIAPNNYTGSLTIDANLDLFLGSFYDTKYGAAVIHTYGADLIINGGKINLECSTAETKTLIALSARNGGNLTINGGDITANSIVGAGATNGCIKADGVLTINGGKLNVKPQKAVGLYGKKGIVINGGTVDIVTPYYGLNVGSKEAPAEFKFNGGTATIMAQYSCYSGAGPILGKDVFAYAGAGAKSCEIYDGTNTKLAQKPWMLLTNDPNQKIEIKDEEEDDSDLPIFTMPTQDPAQTPAGTNATVAPTNGAVAPNATQTPKALDATQTPKPTEAPEVPVAGDIRVEIVEGYMIEIPQTLIDAGLDTVEKIQERMVNSLWTIDENIDSIALFDACLKYFDGENWIKADETHFPEDGVLKVVLPYPEGTDMNTNFTALHMFTSTAFDKIPGQIELLLPVNTENGIEVEVTGLSPIILGWNAEQAAEGGADVEENSNVLAEPENSKTGDTGVAMVAALMVIAMFGMVAVVVVGKKRIA